VATDSRFDKIIRLFCKRALQKRRYSAKETYNFIDPTDRSHPIVDRGTFTFTFMAGCTCVETCYDGMHLCGSVIIYHNIYI